MTMLKLEIGAPARQFARNRLARHGDLLALIAITAAPGTLLVGLLPLPLVLPMLSIVSFVIAGVVAIFAYRKRVPRTAPGVTLWDVAGVFTAMWIAAGIFSGPTRLFRFFDWLATPTYQARQASTGDALGTLPTHTLIFSPIEELVTMELAAPGAIAALFQVVMIDLALAGDNAIVVGMAAAGLPQEQRTRAILLGMTGSAVLLILFAGITTQLLRFVGLLLAGGILLLWVCWKMWRELRSQIREETEAIEALTGFDLNADGTIAGRARPKTLAQAAGQIIVADVSMSLDNVLAVAGAAREHPIVLIFGLSLSVLTMGIAARFIAGLLHKYRWIAYIGLAVILYVALGMVYRGADELLAVARL